MSLLGVLSSTLALGAAGVAVRWVPCRRDALGRARPFPVWSVSVLTALAVAAAVPIVRNHQQERQLSRVASALAGKPVTVACQTTASALVDAGAELGYVAFGPDGPQPHTVIKRDPCTRLRAYAGGNKAEPSLEEVVAVHVLAHEAMDMRGEMSEAAAECQAMQRDATSARLLGATPAQAVALAQRYWVKVYPLMPADYRSGDCRPGGALDEGLPNSPWR